MLRRGNARQSPGGEDKLKRSSLLGLVRLGRRTITFHKGRAEIPAYAFFWP